MIAVSQRRPFKSEGIAISYDGQFLVTESSESLEYEVLDINMKPIDGAKKKGYALCMSDKMWFNIKINPLPKITPSYYRVCVSKIHRPSEVICVPPGVHIHDDYSFTYSTMMLVEGEYCAFKPKSYREAIYGGKDLTKIIGQYPSSGIEWDKVPPILLGVLIDDLTDLTVLSINELFDLFEFLIMLHAEQRLQTVAFAISICAKFENRKHIAEYFERYPKLFLYIHLELCKLYATIH